MYEKNRSIAARPVACAYAAIAAVAVLALGSDASQAQAQQPKAAPAKQPGAQAKTKKTQSSWVKLCDTAPSFKKKICLTHHERLDGNTGSVLVSAAVRKIEGVDKEQFLVMVPLGMAIPPGIRVTIDDEKPIPLKYSICHSAGCTAEVPATTDLVEMLKKGNKLMVAAINIAGKPVGFPVPLNGFTKAYQGPPVDNKKYQEARRKLLVMIRKRQAELLQKARDAQRTKPSGQKKPAPKKQ